MFNEKNRILEDEFKLLLLSDILPYIIIRDVAFYFHCKWFDIDCILFLLDL